MPIPTHQQDKINRIQELFHKLDDEIEIFKTKTSLGCVNGCGRCCENPDVCATVVEVMPLAYEIWNKGHAEMFLEKIRVDQKGWCIFYQTDPAIAGNGRCSVYPWRPLICRLFGYAAKKDKHGQAGLVTCSTMKNHCAPEYQTTTERLTVGSLSAPMMQEYAMQVFNIDPSLGQEQMPINQAVAIAIEKVDMFMREE